MRFGDWMLEAGYRLRELDRIEHYLPDSPSTFSSLLHRFLSSPAAEQLLRGVCEELIRLGANDLLTELDDSAEDYYAITPEEMQEQFSARKALKRKKVVPADKAELERKAKEAHADLEKKNARGKIGGRTVVFENPMELGRGRSMTFVH